jgi:hypothetical protein
VQKAHREHHARLAGTIQQALEILQHPLMGLLVRCAVRDSETIHQRLSAANGLAQTPKLLDEA